MYEKYFKLITVLFRRHKKHLPSWLENTFIGGVLHIGLSIFVSAWLFQGMLYMDKREVVLKIILDLVMVTILMVIGIPLLGSFLVAHSLNFAFNGQWFAMYTHMGATNVTPEKFLSYILGMRKRLNACSFIECAVAFGSLSKGAYKSTSDMDIRICPKKGILNWLKADIWAVVERSRAFISGFPLDMYLFDIVTIKRKMRTDEPPVIFVNHSCVLQQSYSELVEFPDFTEKFIENNCRGCQCVY